MSSNLARVIMPATLNISAAVLQAVFLGGSAPNTPAVRGDLLFWCDSRARSLACLA